MATTTREYQVPYGRRTLRFTLPPGMEGEVLTTPSAPALADLAAAVRQALAQPVAGPRLRDLARPGQRVTIVVTDSTRLCPDDVLVPALLEELQAAGVRPADVTVVIGIGLHRPSTPEEKRAMLGTVVDQVRVVDPRPQDPAWLVDLGTTSNGVPAVVSRLVAEADLVVATGVVEPHQYAGWSGGRKTVAIGAGSEATIAATHGPAMLDHPRVRLAVLEGNPFHQAVTEIAERAGLRFIINVVLNEDDAVTAVMAGAPRETFARLVETAARLYTVPLAGQADIAIAGVGYPKDSNLYHASRAATYLYFAPVPVVRPGGVVIIPAEAPEGAGQGVGEQRFRDLMRAYASPAALVAAARQHGYPPGGQRAYMLARVLEEWTVIIVGAADPQVVRDLKLVPARTMEEALAIAAERVGHRARVVVIPHALRTLPVVRV